MINTNEKMPPDDLEALLPWHAVGTLNGADAEMVDKAVARDKELARRLALAREEMTETILLNEALGVPSARAMESLFKAIDKERKSVRRETGAGIIAWVADLLSPRLLALAGSAAAVIILLQAGIITKMVMQEEPAAPFETASAPTPATRGIDVGAYALVRFAPQANMADVTRLLDTRGAVIVNGPRPGGPGGMYRVLLARSRLTADELERAVRDFQSAAGNLVSFAAPTE